MPDPRGRAMLLAVEGGGQDRDRLAGAKEGRSQGVVLLKKNDFCINYYLLLYLFFRFKIFFFIFYSTSGLNLAY